MRNAALVFPFLKGKKTGIRDGAGRIILPPRYDFIGPSGDFFTVQKGNKWGLLDSKGAVVIALSDQFSFLGTVSEGLVAFQKNKKYGFLDITGTTVIPASFSLVENFSEGLAAVCDNRGRWGFVDRKGSMAVDFGFDYADSFSHGCARASPAHAPDQFGLIDKKGKWVLRPRFDSVGDWSPQGWPVSRRTRQKVWVGFFNRARGLVWDLKRIKALSLDATNIKRMRRAFHRLIDFYFSKSCPCDFASFRSFIQWQGPPMFRDAELLFEELKPRLCLLEEPSPESGLMENASDLYACPVCNNRYRIRFNEVNAFFEFETIEILHPDLSPREADPVGPIPVFFGFKGFGPMPDKKKYPRAPLNHVIRFLRTR